MGAALAAVLVTGALASISAAASAPAPGQITTFAGTIGEGVATGVAQRPRSMASFGTKVYVGSESYYVIRELDTETGLQRVIAGNGFDERGNPARRGDGGSARDASLGYIEAMAVDAGGNVYAADSASFYVRRITPQGSISIVAGNGVRGMTGDGGPARSASLGYISALAVDAAGNLYIADTDNRRIRRVSPSGVITTIAGNGTNDNSAGPGDGLPAIDIAIQPRSLAVDATGRLYFGDALNGRVRAILADGTVTTVAGGGADLPSVGGIPAASADLFPLDLAFAPDGSLYVSDVYFASRIDLANGTVARVAGTGSPHYTGFDTGSRTIAPGQLATRTAMNAPQRLTVAADGNLYIGDMFENRVFRVDAEGVISVAAGTGYFHLAGDGGPATAAMFSQARDMLVDPAGGVVIADQYNQRVRRIDPSGRITTIAGSGDTFGGFGGDGGPATSALLRYPSGVALDAIGNLYIADQFNFRIRRVDLLGTITTFALVPHVEGRYTQTGGIAVDASGNVYLSQIWPRRILKFNPLGQATTLAGSDAYDSTSTAPHYPQGLALSPDGFLYVADSYGGRVLKINTVTGATTFPADGAWKMPTDVAVDAAGNAYVADGPHVRRMDSAGRLTTVAGTGVRGSTGDGGPATSARISSTAVAVFGSDLLIMDEGVGEVIRRVTGVDTIVTDTVRSTGWNGYGMLGTGNTSDRRAPTAASGLRDAVAVSAGLVHTLAVRRDGTLWASGWNALGTLGTGTTIDTAAFVQVHPMAGVTAVAAGAYHSLAVKSDGTVWAWGWNVAGQLGDGTTTTRLSPVQVPGLTGVVAVSAGLFHSVAAKADGTVWTWGSNGVGQLGLGHTMDQHRPVMVPGLSNVRSVAAGGHHTLAANTLGNLFAWGWNATGQVGVGSTVDQYSPRLLPTVTGARQVAAGMLHSAVVTADGAVWTFGWNGWGQLGDGTTIDRGQPRQVPQLAGMMSVTAGAYHTMAVTSTQQVFAWGWNGLGQFGDGTTTSRTSPVAVPGLDGLVSISGGYAHTAAG
jgi:YD repeat-containing protein